MFKGFFYLKPDNAQRIENSRRLGENELWSSQNMHRHLALLYRVVPTEVSSFEVLADLTPTMMTRHQSKGGACRWVNTLLFRASTMVPPGKCIIFNPDHRVPATTIHPSSSLISSAGLVVMVEDRVAGMAFHDFGFPSAHPACRCLLSVP